MGSVVAAAFLFAGILSVLRYGRALRVQRSPLVAMALAARLVALALAAALLFLVFFPADRPSDERGDRERQRVVVLHDRSASMGSSDGDRSRAGLADDVWTDLVAAAGEPGREADVLRLFFGANVVNEDRADRLDSSATCMGKAIPAALARVGTGAVLVVSDGAFTDGPVSPHLLQAAANRGTRVFAVCPVSSGDDNVDAAVVHVSSAPVNPPRVSAVLSFVGGGEQDARVTFSVDGEVEQETSVRLRPGERRTSSWPLPELDVGWHEFAVAVSPVPEEHALSNNLRRGVFETVARDHVLFVHGRPGREPSQLYRLLVSRFGERLRLLSVFDAAEAGVSERDCALVVLADVSPEQLPEDIRGIVRDGRTPCLFVAGPSLREWQPELPDLLARVPGSEPDAPDPPPRPFLVEAVPGRGPTGFGTIADARLPVWLPTEIGPGDRAISLLVARGAGASFSVLVADSAETPRRVVSLCSTTWKWALHPERHIQEGYGVFWGTALDWLTQSLSGEWQLDLSFGEGYGKGTGVPVRIRPRAGAVDLALSGPVLLRVEQGGEERSARMAALPEDNAHEYRFVGGEPGEVVWFQARAQTRDGWVRSQRRPLLLEMAAAERAEGRPRLDLLASLVADQEMDVCTFPERRALIERLLGEQPESPAVEQRERQKVPESFIALAIALLLGFEWFVERQGQRT